MYCYALRPIDYWGGWMDQKQYCASIAENAQDLADVAERLEEAASLLRRGQDAARLKLRWEGDHDGVWYSVLPTDRGEGTLIAAWKQGNNGTTFVVCEQELPGLKCLTSYIA
jgi:hypothetical protein